MSERQNLRPAQTPARPLPTREGAEDAWVEDYLDHLSAPLVGIVPLAERRGLRDELRAHLEALADEYVFQGNSRPEATAAALQELGEPWAIGQTFLREWLQGCPHAGPARLTRQAALRAFGFFGVAAVLNWLLIEQRDLNQPSGDLMPWIVLLAALSPLVAGPLTGLGLPARMGRGLCWALGILSLHALTVGALLLPQTDGFGFALCLLLWWLPGGWLSATATAHLVRSHRRQRFLKSVR